MNAVNENTLAGFRQIAADMLGKTDWQWVGAHMSQRMFGISEQRAKDYAKRFGGEASRMTEEIEIEGYGTGVDCDGRQLR